MCSQEGRKTDPNCLTQAEINCDVGFLHQKINSYNQSVAFLAAVIRNTVYNQRDIFPKLHLYIEQDKRKCSTDGHMLFYMLKGVMAEIKLTLLQKTREQIYKLDIQMKGSAPQIRDYVCALNDLAFKYSEVDVIMEHHELLDLFRRKDRALIGQHPNTHFISMLHSTEFDT